MKRRDRVLSMDEVALVWHAAGKLHDFGRITRLLLLTGATRLREIAELCWAEVNLEKRQIELSGARTKNGEGHIIPPDRSRHRPSPPAAN